MSLSVNPISFKKRTHIWVEIEICWSKFKREEEKRRNKSKTEKENVCVCQGWGEN